jgi:hypothetical protein
MSVTEAQAAHEVLVQQDAEIAEWVQAILEHGGEADAEQAQRFIATYDRLTTRLNSEPPPALPEQAVSTIRKLIIQGMEAERRDRPIDLLNDLLVCAEGIRHVIRDVLDGDVPVDPQDAAALIQQIEEWLPGINRVEIAALLGTTPRTLQRWASSRPTPTPRAVLVARLVALLRHGWTAPGVVAWFTRTRRDLGNQTPLEVLSDPARERDLLELARAGRAQHAG